jgi:hypothetical protein
MTGLGALEIHSLSVNVRARCLVDGVSFKATPGEIIEGPKPELGPWPTRLPHRDCANISCASSSAMIALPDSPRTFGGARSRTKAQRGRIRLASESGLVV